MWIFELKGLTVILSIASPHFLSSKLSQLHCTLIKLLMPKVTLNLKEMGFDF